MAATEQQIDELIRAMGLIVRRVRASGQREQLSLTEAMVLGRLVREGPQTSAELARAEGMKPQSMGATVAALEEAGLVARTPHPTDGRQMLVTVSERGFEVRARARDAKRLWLANAVAQLDDQERETLLAVTGILRRLAERQEP
ncbi:DNA-binding transcriptional regulator, MarR family [Bryocella elongata]|uniref:DNA-binding transcriptional regulator, MarR family n=1 Tax=Bryocella elongata TaxID=863522 RepID=A0A1H5TMQ3_9BACT|nr:MarR family transcriptional regulator [Bryocella elongata]SEF64054.1 DNA-binding transcriptional regulator, MarR family [Bryocella elongata]